MKLEEYEDLINHSFRRTMFEMAHNKIKELYSDEFLVYPKCIFGSKMKFLTKLKEQWGL